MPDMQIRILSGTDIPRGTDIRRREFVRRAVTERIANLREAAEFLRRDPSTISRWL